MNNITQWQFYDTYNGFLYLFTEDNDYSAVRVIKSCSGGCKVQVNYLKIEESLLSQFKTSLGAFVVKDSGIISGSLDYYHPDNYSLTITNSDGKVIFDFMAAVLLDSIKD